MPALQLVLNPVTQDSDAVAGLGYISDLLVQCKVREKTYLEEETSGNSIPGQRYYNQSPQAPRRFLST